MRSKDTIFFTEKAQGGHGQSAQNITDSDIGEWGSYTYAIRNAKNWDQRYLAPEGAVQSKGTCKLPRQKGD